MIKHKDMKNFLIIFLIFNFVGIPMIVGAQEINFDQINLDQINLDKLPDLSFESNGENISSNDLLGFFTNLYKLGTQAKKLVLKVWGIASSFLEEVTGFTLGQILTKLINIIIGIIGAMINLLTEVIGD